MPTVILLDNSLSMCQNINGHIPITTKRQISHQIIKHLVDHISKNEKLEQLALVAYSSTAQVLSQFTRDYEKIKESLTCLPVGDTACLEEGCNKVSDLVIAEFACFTNIHILLITDDTEQLESFSVKNMCQKIKEHKKILKNHYFTNGIDYDEHINFNSILNEEILNTTLKYPFSFPNRLDIICLSEFESEDSPGFIKIDEMSNKLEILSKFSKKKVHFGFNEETFQPVEWQEKYMRKLQALNEMIELNNTSGSLYLTRVNGRESGEFMTPQFCEQIFADLFRIYTCSLKCGNIKVKINLIPAPLVFRGYQNHIYVERSMGRNFEICGFLNISELTTIPTITRHLIQKNYDNDNQVSFLTLLHTCLKSESVSAIVLLDQDWYGAISSWHDTKSTDKTKSSLMLTVFTPGADILQNIMNKLKNQQQGNQQRNFSIKSYTKSCIVWYRQESLISDLQKIIRNAKKMQDKMPIFYKELNKVRRAALTFGFYELFEGVALMLQREMTNTNNMANQEMLLQLNHCIFCLRSPEFREFRKDIQPFIANQIFTRKNQK